MAQFFTDFSEYDTGSFPNGADWTEVWDIGGWNILSDVEYTGGQYLEGDDGSNSYNAVSWDEVGNTSDGEIVLRFKADWPGGGDNPTLAGVLRGSGSSGSENGYMVVKSGGEGFPGDSHQFRITIREISDGEDNSLGSEVIISSLSEDDILWMRFRADGNELKARGWIDDEPEPETWQLETTDSTHTSGWTGLRSAGIHRPHEFDVLGVGTDGDSAPTEPVTEADILGTVTVDGLPQEGAKVYLLDGESLVAVETTDSQGEYSFSADPGKYHVTAEHENAEVLTEFSKPNIEVE